MNFRLVCKLLSIVCLLIGVTMVFSLPWAWPVLGRRTAETFETFEQAGFFGLIVSIAASLMCGALLWRFGKSAKGDLYRKEAMAVVGLSWMVATLLGALPFLLSGTSHKLSVRIFESHEFAPQVYGRLVDPVSKEEFQLLQILLKVGARGLSEEQLIAAYQSPEVLDVFADLQANEPWDEVLIGPGEDDSQRLDRRNNHRVRPVRMNIADALFESQSGFSTTGATVIADLEDPVLVPHCILFWRSSTHFLGGLGIIVLFVVLLGQGSAGKTLMRNEMPGPTKEGSHSRMQHTAWLFAGIYCGLTVILAAILFVLGMNFFDAMCHAFGTMATGGFSTYNTSLGHFAQEDVSRGAIIEYVVVLFMILAGTNFTLLYFLMVRRPDRLLADVEWRFYMAIIFVASFLVIGFGLAYNDFRGGEEEMAWHTELLYAIRYGLFQVVSILTTTGYGTHDFDQWNSFGRGVLFLLMFVGGSAGSTAGGMKIIRHILFHKILYLQLEKSFHPTVVRPLRLGGKPMEDPDLQHNILIYFSMVLVIFVLSWMLILTIEPDATWGSGPAHIEHKLIDTATSIAATLNNIGPGLGIVGATQNYAHFSWWTKLLFTWLMMLGRLEIFAILVLFMPSFWRSR
ncbi:MAG: TrkH family potassium uptake protein [Pirellulaceae bacterium]